MTVVAKRTRRAKPQPESCLGYVESVAAQFILHEGTQIFLKGKDVKIRPMTATQASVVGWLNSAKLETNTSCVPMQTMVFTTELQAKRFYDDALNETRMTHRTLDSTGKVEWHSSNQE